jgi:hypothetical protein
VATVVAKVEAAVYPDAVLGDGDVILRADGPLAGRGDPFALKLSIRGRDGEAGDS